MIITRMALKNFRGHIDSKIYFDDSLNVLIGKNDVGKSSVLEALEIFFNNDSVKIEPLDCNKFANDKKVTIQVSFKVDHSKTYTIDTIPTNLSREFLLDQDRNLTIEKTWDCSKKTVTQSSLSTYIIADYPQHFSTPLVSLKISELREILKSTNPASGADKRKSSEIRQEIYESLKHELTTKTETRIPIDAEDGKKIYDSIKNELPMYFLFKSDRENKDSDSEVQSPLKVITKNIISTLEDQLNELKQQVETAAIDIGKRTIEKLAEMNPDIAQQLKPNMSSKPWDSLFSFNFEDEHGIPINKRGSGVRRLILLNYFRAEAERSRESHRSVIYAVEEPETAQHPDWQIKLLDALYTLSKSEKTQIFITTHSPNLAANIDYNNLVYMYKDNNQICFKKDEIDVLEMVCESLGLHQNIEINKTLTSLKLIICTEGITDIEFLKNIGLNIFSINLQSHPNILMIPLGGGNLQHFANQVYLSKLGTPEIHIYDNDVKKYQGIVRKINNSRPNSKAFNTKFYEIENYIHPSLYLPPLNRTGLACQLERSKLPR